MGPRGQVWPYGVTEESWDGMALGIDCGGGYTRLHVVKLHRHTHTHTHTHTESLTGKI